MKRSTIGRRDGLTLAGAAALASLASLVPAGVRAALDDRPIRLVVPFPPGGGTDVIGRLLAQGLGEALHTTVVVDNVPGATGTVGSAQVARARPDGHTLLLGISGTHAIAPALFKSLPYQPERDFVAIARVAFGGNLLVANPTYPANDATGMVALEKRRGTPLLYGSWGIGSGGHLAGESIHVATGLPMQHVPYKGVGPLLQDLVAGQLMVGMVDVPAGEPLVRAGKLKALATTGSKRVPALPNVPTLLEGGIPFGTDSWFALFAPAGLPAAELQVLVRASAQATQRPEYADRVQALGMAPDPVPREAFMAEWHRDLSTWAQLVRTSGATME